MKPRGRYYFIVVIVLLSLALLLFLKPKSRSNRSNIMVADYQLVLEIANTSKEKEQGLSDRKDLCSDCGMLFVFDQPGFYAFWMRRMYFDIDILWIVDNRVVDITYNAKVPPKEELENPKTIYQSEVPVDQVLEVNAGWAEKKGVKVGDTIAIK